ncbi:hypothetical protein HPP92_000576 [Vanilla planifolia]|uniref:Uncharacterized protein n=1 Tax=Vanilla planifolia TaxID=51239 RepID=A0A835S334_VANPL|nr:hypothetical protein HPP92_000628 [Vanilla planifolia]KAG0500461.1 hypothetical protein HPP92_000533 [Vanilla planifolia]KAG0500504.1 hypothetical protein HPP92_000576 [Vanilla planifolia]
MAEGIKQKSCGFLLPGRKGDHEDCEPNDSAMLSSCSGSAEDEASSSSPDDGPLFEMSSLMADLPIE